MKSKPWIAVHLFTHKVLGNYATDVQAYAENINEPIDVQYAPGAREVKK